jgi:hypothetical protein
MYKKNKINPLQRNNFFYDMKNNKFYKIPVHSLEELNQIF